MTTAKLTASNSLRNAHNQHVMHRCYALTPPLDGHSHVVVSLVEPDDQVCQNSSRVFASDEQGTITSYSELAICEPRAGMDADIAALTSLGYDEVW